MQPPAVAHSGSLPVVRGRRSLTGSYADTSRSGTTGGMATTYLSADQLCDELGISKDTLYKWRAVGSAPRAMRLPNGKLRFRRADVEAWTEGLLV